MDPIIINPADVWQIVLAVCGGVITLPDAGAVLAGTVHKISSLRACCPGVHHLPAVKKTPE